MELGLNKIQKEIDELGPNLRSIVPNSERKFRKLEARVSYVTDQM